MDPLGETWSCAPFFAPATATGYTCLGFVWDKGVMRALPTLGGNNGYAAAANDRGQVVGWAENTVHDPTCVAPQVLQFRAVLWEPKKNRLQELPPLPGDTSGAATAINDRGQVVGIEPGYPGILTTAQDINDRGEITGRAFDPATGERPTFVATPISR